MTNQISEQSFISTESLSSRGGAELAFPTDQPSQPIEPLLCQLSGTYCTYLTKLNNQPVQCLDPVDCVRNGCKALRPVNQPKKRR